MPRSNFFSTPGKRHNHDEIAGKPIRKQDRFLQRTRVFQCLVAHRDIGEVPQTVQIHDAPCNLPRFHSSLIVVVVALLPRPKCTGLAIEGFAMTLAFVIAIAVIVHKHRQVQVLLDLLKPVFKECIRNDQQSGTRWDQLSFPQEAFSALRRDQLPVSFVHADLQPQKVLPYQFPLGAGRHGPLSPAADVLLWNSSSQQRAQVLLETLERRESNPSVEVVSTGDCFGVVAPSKGWR
mmetsp:Transcript_97791/g.198618  ORF Transcript_97791/g.198618 Transcript_97791/m.198618 type:complete len:235 (+) Transcript_97791:1-705(+)